MSASTHIALGSSTRGLHVLIGTFNVVICRRLQGRWIVATFDVIPYDGEMISSAVIDGQRVVYSIIPEPEVYEVLPDLPEWSPELLRDFATRFIERPITGSMVRSCGHAGLLVSRTDIGDLVLGLPVDAEITLPMSGYQGCVEIGADHKMYLWRVSPMSFTVCEMPTINSLRIARILAQTIPDRTVLPVVQP